jgi:hypothetical protein
MDSMATYDIEMGSSKVTARKHNINKAWGWRVDAAGDFIIYKRKNNIKKKKKERT